MSKRKDFDFVVIGGGIVGLTIAWRLVQAGFKSILVLEKEQQLGMHASGRNSGVLHAGFYYSAESLKAKLCALGSRLMMEYASEKQIRFIKTGKVVVATDSEGVRQIPVLLERAKTNGIELHQITLDELKEREPEARSVEAALFSPNTAVIDSKSVLKSLEDDLMTSGVTIMKGSRLDRVLIDQKQVECGGVVFGFGHLVNCAGLYADQVAHSMGVGLKYTLLPFKGLYKKIRPEVASKFRGSIYPVPDLRVPFLGVHVTKNVFGEVYVGPTAIPAFGRENYGVLSGISPIEGLRMATHLGAMFLRNAQGMRQLVVEEMDRYFDSGFLKAVQKIAPGLDRKDLLPTNKVGIRAQLFDREKGQLEMDFVVESGNHSTHILNAISPAFSASFAFSTWIVENRILRKTQSSNFKQQLEGTDLEA